MPSIRLSVLLMWAAVGAGAQRPADRGALMIMRATDTVVLDRFVRSGDTLRGILEVRAQPRIEYLARLTPDGGVQSLLLGVSRLGAPSTEAPMQRVKLTVDGDTVIAETAAGIQRVPTKVGAIPMFNNALALTELFTRAAAASGGVANIPYFAVNGGVTFVVSVRSALADTMTVAIAQQIERLEVDPTGRILGGRIGGTKLEFVRGGPELASNLALTLRDSAIAPATDYSAPKGAPYTAEEIRLPGPQGATLGGTLTEPKGRGPWPAVVTIGGSGQHDRDEYIPYAGGIRLFREVADTLGRRGIAVLRLDKRGVGASTGSAANATSADFADDARAALAYLRTRLDIDPTRLAVIGHSEGGAIAPMVAASDSALRAVVVMAGPGVKAIEISMAQNKLIVERDTTLTPAQRDSILRAARAALAPENQRIPWVKYWMAYDPAPVARQVRAPTLILQGATDTQVSPDNADKLAALIRAGGNRDVTVKLFPATDHLFVVDPDGNFQNYDQLKNPRINPTVLSAMADWLVAKLR